MNLSKIPATVVTGFLGSGKTTLLSHLIKHAAGKRIAVLVNEFGQLDIDAELIRSCALDHDCPPAAAAPGIATDGIYELANGCICCTVEEEFLPVMRQLVERRADIDHILIETSGLALPKPLVQAFNWPEIKQYCSVDAVVTVVDAAALADGRLAHDPQQVERQRAADANLDHTRSLDELLEDQLGAADVVLLSKSDLLDPAQLQRAEDTLAAQVDPSVKCLSIQHGQIRPEWLLGLGLASEDRIEQVHTHHDQHHATDQAHHHAHDDFNSVCVELGEVHADDLAQCLQTLLAQHTILRVKGFLALPGKPMRQVVQGVGARLQRYFDRAWRADETRRSRVVLIGKDLVAADLHAALSAAQV